jgi:hypothetical protein
MSDPLATYLHDHLAGSNFAIELLENLAREHSDEPLGHFARRELVQLKEERATLERIIDLVGPQGAPLKEAATWVVEKISRFKLTHAGSGELGKLEALEALALGIHGRVALWRTLALIAPSDHRLHDLNFAALAASAASQHSRVEERRLEVARIALLEQPANER